MINNKKLLMYVLVTNLLFINQAYALIDYSNLHNNHEVISKYESGGKSYKAAVKDSYNGYSYGKWQISTKRVNTQISTFDSFLDYLKLKNTKYYNTLINAGGYKAAFSGDSVFITKWKKLCEEERFKKIYDDFILNSQIIPAYKKMENTNDPMLQKVIEWGLSDNTIQAALHSAIIQHGPTGGYKLVQYTCKTYKLDDKKTFLKNLYKARMSKYPKYKKRYTQEYNDLKLSL